MAGQLSRAEVKEIMSEALSKVADGFDPNASDFETLTFDHFHDFHKEVFLNWVKRLYMDKTFVHPSGQTFCYTIALNPDMIDRWDNFGACIDFLFRKQQTMKVEEKVDMV